MEPDKFFIVPYRDRENQLEIFVNHMTKLMEGENYQILFIHQKDNRHFNRGAMKNIGFLYVKKKYPQTKIFGITTGLPVMKINYSLGYEPVTFSELTDDNEFWKGCQTCNNYDILQRTKRKMCLCTGMLYNPKKNK